jgi:hypothetical protein
MGGKFTRGTTTLMVFLSWWSTGPGIERQMSLNCSRQPPHCELYDDDIAVCSFQDVCYPELGDSMVMKNKDTKKWKASVNVALTSINQYGDEIGESTLNYSVYLDGSLIDIVTRLEKMREASE